MPQAEQQKAADQIWAAAAVVVEKGGQKAAAAEKIDWASLDLTLKK